MRSFRLERAIALAPILLTALVCSGCPELNTQPDYLGEKNSLMSVPDPVPADDALAPYKTPDGNAVVDAADPQPATDALAPAPSAAATLAPETLGDYTRPKAGIFDHGSISIIEERGLSDQARRAQ